MSALMNVEVIGYITLVASAVVVCVAYGLSVVTGGLGLIEDVA